MQPHESPNGAEPGSFIHAAEAWFLSLGMAIPKEPELPCSFQGMLDDFVDVGPYHPSMFEASDD